jgi:hypothetical protein
MFLSSDPIPAARPLAHGRVATGLLLLIVAGCARSAPLPDAPTPQVAERYSTLRPGDPRIVARRPSGTECFDLEAVSADDTTRRRLGTLVHEWGVGGRGPDGLVIDRSAYAQQTEDSMVYDLATLAPVREDLRVGDLRIRLRYRGATVERMVQRGDSVAPFHSITFDRPVFGFNQRELLLRVVRLQPGDTIILPLYSEIDAVLELDTLSLASNPSSGSPAGTIQLRFADPAIVSITTVDILTGRIVDEQIRSRRRPGRLSRKLSSTSLGCGQTG